MNWFYFLCAVLRKLKFTGRSICCNAQKVGKTVTKTGNSRSHYYIVAGFEDLGQFDFILVISRIGNKIYIISKNVVA